MGAPAPGQEEQVLLHEPAGPLQRQHGVGRGAKLDQDQWVITEDDDDDSSCSLGNSTDTNGSTSSSSDMVDDATSPTSSCSSSNSNGPLYELSDLMADLPIKRGLSKFYQGKSQSFTSLSKITSIEDLAKKETPYTRKMKSSKSYANGLDAHKHYPLPRATISKKVSRSGHDVSALSFSGRKGNFLGSTSRLPPFPVQKKLFQV